ncbi:uncharacterized protein [Miscanthus floridulus]|uniref:uncharacterized protein n=1 Tax=Miscanthus floridulus TaxID=154761 RepID=UPI003458C853
MASRRTPPSELVDDDAITEVLLRLPPEEPAYLVRASLVCRQWRRVLSDPGFHRLYVGFHRTPPLLGFFNSSRDGRVLLQRRPVQLEDDDAGALGCLVWDAITGDRHELRWPNNVPMRSAVVLCAAAGCDHSDCRGGPFLVLCAGVHIHSTGWRAYAYVYSSQLRAWGAPVYLDLCGYRYFDEQIRAVVIGDQVYFCRFLLGEAILKYDLRKQCLSLIDSPDLSGMDTDVELMATEEGLLGLASARGSRLHLWSRTMEAAGVVGWEESRVIDLQKKISPADNGSSIIKEANVIGFAEGANAIFVGTDAGTFVMDLKSGRARKILVE